MAVIKAKAKKVIESFIPLVQDSLIAPLVVTRISGENFKGAENDSVILKLPGTRAKVREYEFRGRTAPIQFDDIAGGQEMVIQIDTHVYSATALEDEHMTLDDVDYVSEVLTPQVEAVAGDFETRVVAGLRSVTAKHEMTIDPDSDPHLVAIEAKRRMSESKVAPTSNRVFLVGSNIAAAWLASDRLSKYDSTGQTGTPALRDSVIGRLSGSAVIEVPELGPNEGYYHHQSSLVLGNVAPYIPRGVSAGAMVQRDGFGMRYIVDYDANYLRDRSIVSSFVGMNEIKDERWLTDGFHDPETGESVASGTPGAVAHAQGEIKPDVIVKNVRIIPITLEGFDATDGVLATP